MAKGKPTPKEHRRATHMQVSEVNIVPVKAVDGLVGFASCVIDRCLYVGSMAVHKRLDGTGYRVTYPVKNIGGRQLNYFHPVTKEAGKSIERAIQEKCVQVFERSDESYGRHSKNTIDHL